MDSNNEYSPTAEAKVHVTPLRSQSFEMTEDLMHLLMKKMFMGTNLVMRMMCRNWRTCIPPWLLRQQKLETTKRVTPTSHCNRMVALHRRLTEKKPLILMEPLTSKLTHSSGAHATYKVRDNAFLIFAQIFGFDLSLSLAAFSLLPFGSSQRVAPVLNPLQRYCVSSFGSVMKKISYRGSSRNGYRYMRQSRSSVFCMHKQWCLHLLTISRCLQMWQLCDSAE